MKYDFSAPTFDWDGKALPKLGAVEQHIGAVAFMALTAPIQAGIDEVLKQTSLAQAVRTGGAHELTHEQAKMIRDRAAVLAQLQGGGAMLATRLAEFIDRSGPYAEMETTAKPKGK